MACPGEATVDTSDDPTVLTIASDCSGMETPALVLREMGIPFRSLWASEIDEHCRSFIRNNCEPERFDRDIKMRDVKTLPTSPDIYFCGFPCQYFSGLRSTKPREDDPRRDVYEYVLGILRFISRPLESGAIAGFT